MCSLPEASHPNFGVSIQPCLAWCTCSRCVETQERDESDVLPGQPVFLLAP